MYDNINLPSGACWTINMRNGWSQSHFSSKKKTPTFTGQINNVKRSDPNKMQENARNLVIQRTRELVRIIYTNIKYKRKNAPKRYRNWVIQRA